MIGHVEWVTHTDAPFIPSAGEIVHLENPLEEPAGGGAVTAAALARFGADVRFFTAVGTDVPITQRLQELG
ncbi:MAG: ribokinase, partial [Gaiellales bacterium]|nr:ribokinase [Gaiellales bacterium]